MKKILKVSGLAGAAALAIIGIAAATTAYATNAQSANGNNGVGWGKMRMGQAVTGTNTAVSGTNITLSGSDNKTYVIDASKAQVIKISDSGKSVIQASGIAVGDTLHVSGTVSGTNVTAVKIIDGAMPGRADMPARKNPAAAGTITAISGNTITLASENGTVYSVDAGNAELVIRKKAGTGLQNSGIVSGDSIVIFGTISGNVITATEIVYGNMPMGNVFGQKPSNQ